MTDTTSAELVGKLTLKTMGVNGSIAAALKQDVPLARVRGVARNIKTAVGSNGDPTFGLTGTFRGTRISDGQTFNSGVCYLPSGLLELVMDPLEAILNGDDRQAKAQGVTFAMDIFAAPDSNKAGYTYKAKLIGETAQADPLEALEKSISDAALPKYPKLPAPDAK